MNPISEPRGFAPSRAGAADLFLGRYVNAGFLGRGSMGQVFLAHPVATPDRKVVVKLMHAHVAADPRFRQFFEREILSLARLRHPYIVQLLDSSLNDPRGPSIVMEHIPGITLEELLVKSGRLAVGHVGLLAGYLCHALEAAHRLGVIHRDLKPANLMIVGAGTLEESVRVMDFGLASLASKPHFTTERLAGGKHTSTQGTPNYISPEQLRGDEVDGRADLYSLGVILYEMLTGQTPFPHDEVPSVLRAHLNERPTSFAMLGVRDVPPAVELVVQLCLEKFPVERPQTARELAQRFSDALGLDIWEAAQPEQATEPSPAVCKPTSYHARNAISYQIEAWMPERIAVVKLRGFLEDMGGKVAESEPGVLRIRIGEPEKVEGSKKKSGQQPLPVEIALLMEKPDARDNRLVITALFRPFTDPALLQLPAWRTKCETLFKELQSYLMAVR